jgi:hypothetical protein
VSEEPYQITERGDPRDRIANQRELPPARAATCSVPGCLTIAEPAGQCQRHVMEERRSQGLCANCGGTRERQPVWNQITNRQLRRAGVPVWQMVCTQCGRAQRPYPEEDPS